VVTLRVIKIDAERRRIGLSRRKVDSPAYADLDWKMALADEVGKAQNEDDSEEKSTLVEEDQGFFQALESINPEETDQTSDSPENQDSE